MIVDIPWLAKQNFNFKGLDLAPTPILLYHTKDQQVERKKKVFNNHKHGFILLQYLYYKHGYLYLLFTQLDYHYARML